MELIDILDIRCVKNPLAATEKYQAITELMDSLASADMLDDYDAVLKAVMEREAVRSTGVGQGFAIPHGKCESVERVVIAIGKTARPIDFKSIDGAPVELIVLLVSPEGQTGAHIQALAKISRVMTEPALRERIFSSNSAEELYDIITSGL
jgi:fructose-specific phosphotransferase system IIA component